MSEGLKDSLTSLRDEGWVAWVFVAAALIGAVAWVLWIVT